MTQDNLKLMGQLIADRERRSQFQQVMLSDLSHLVTARLHEQAAQLPIDNSDEPLEEEK